ncbi:hypothetical protein [Brachybacterium fresconis]|uniref:Peptidoglycan/LPS O-acetylase OafA/YrhL n=1 Tax=Brachybacterium fresconis TaxID=173363 RepID=A0ABS4YHT6_9MICO|nr:hypothetical protein [Brachybacterium fresconis]MBP2408321.1 peptidoglycan/LPS O-acetylase OafA/YrhL [Brachybacterium fresconis]
MIYAFLLLFAGGMVLGGAWSFHRSQKPRWAVVAMALAGLACIGASLWRIQAG